VPLACACTLANLSPSSSEMPKRPCEDWCAGHWRSWQFKCVHFSRCRGCEACSFPPAQHPQNTTAISVDASASLKPTSHGSITASATSAFQLAAVASDCTVPGTVRGLVRQALGGMAIQVCALRPLSRLRGVHFTGATSAASPSTASTSFDAAASLKPTSHGSITASAASAAQLAAVASDCTVPLHGVVH
jgi:hypothetical protein